MYRTNDLCQINNTLPFPHMTDEIHNVVGDELADDEIDELDIPDDKIGVVTHRIDPNDPYSQITTYQQTNDNTFQNIKVNTETSSIKEMCELATQIARLKRIGKEQVTCELIQNTAEFKNFYKAYPIITRLIVDDDLYHPEGFKKYLKNLSKQKKVSPAGVEYWYKDHIEYAESQIDYIKAIYHANGKRTDSREVAAYIHKMRKEYQRVAADIDKTVKDLQRPSRTLFPTLEGCRREIAEQIAFIKKNKESYPSLIPPTSNSKLPAK